jgi:NADPH2:quinone reductase
MLEGPCRARDDFGDFVKREPQASAAALGQLAQWYAQGKIKPVIDQRLPLAELPAAYARMSSRQVRGKLLLVNA